MKQYPKVTAHVLLQDKLTDLTEEGIDVAFRVGEINLPDMVAVCVGHIYPVVCVSADYFKTEAKIYEPNDLKFAKNIKNMAIYKGKHWKFNCNGKVQEITVPTSFTTNDIDSAIAHCVAGLGVGVFFSYQVEALIKAGIIIEILQPFRLQNIPVSLIYPNTKRHLSRTNYFIAYAKNALIARLDKA